MKKFLPTLGVFLTIFFISFGVSTQFHFRPPWSLDYFNPLAASFLQKELDIVNPPVTYDLVNVGGKWYAPWGPLPALFLMPVQVIMGRFVPTLYLTLLFASADAAVFFLLLERMKKDFFPRMTTADILLAIALFAFGTTHFYVGTLGSVWHVDQMVTNFFGTLGIFFILKNQRRTKDYFFSVSSMSIALLGRPTIVLLVTLPAFLYVWDHIVSPAVISENRWSACVRGLVIFGIPLGISSTLFFGYNWLRFHTMLEYGYRFIRESPYLAQIRLRYGAFSLSHLKTNLWYMLFELPTIEWKNGLTMNINLKGNSIFFLTPPFLAIFRAVPLVIRKKRLTANPVIASLWLAAIITILPSLLIYSTGWMQLGYRYSLDITAILVLLALFGIKGKIRGIFAAGIAWSIAMYLYGISILQ